MVINMIAGVALYNKVVQRYLIVVSTYIRYALIYISVDVGVSDVKNLIFTVKITNFELIYGQLYLIYGQKCENWGVLYI